MVGNLALVVDDDVSHVVMVGHFLRTRGFSVVTASDAIGAVMMAAKHSPAIILLDFDMPAGSGASVYERLMGINQTAQTPIIFISGRGIAALTQAIKPLPHLRFLSKPLDLSELEHSLQALLPGFQAGPLDLGG